MLRSYLQRAHISSEIPNQAVPLVMPEIRFRHYGPIITSHPLLGYTIVIQSFPVYIHIKTALDMIEKSLQYHMQSAKAVLLKGRLVERQVFDSRESLNE